MQNSGRGKALRKTLSLEEALIECARLLRSGLSVEAVAGRLPSIALRKIKEIERSLPKSADKGGNEAPKESPRRPSRRNAEPQTSPELALTRVGLLGRLAPGDSIETRTAKFEALWTLSDSEIACGMRTLSAQQIVDEIAERRGKADRRS